MELQEFYRGLSEGRREGTLHLSFDLCGGALADLLFAAEVENIEECFITMQAGQVIVDGKSRLFYWNKGERFKTRIVCREQGGKIFYQASFRSDFEGTLGDFFGRVAPSMIAEESGAQAFVPLVSNFPVSKPNLSFDSENIDRTFPLCFFARTR